MLTLVNEIEASILDQYPSVFSSLGTFQNACEIKLKPEGQPVVLYTARNVLLPLRKKIQEELTRMESLGVITEVEEPTAWCSGMVAVPKKSGRIRICVDLLPLNESVMREIWRCIHCPMLMRL